MTSRSVLIYVRNKRQAVGEFFRVLPGGGRISLAEPLNRDRLGFNEINKDEYYGYDADVAARHVQLKQFVSPRFHTHSAVSHWRLGALWGSS